MKSRFPLLLIVFLLAVLIPSLTLSILAFRSIRSEAYLIEKKYEESLTHFQTNMANTIFTEIKNILEDARKASVYLADQPKSVKELEQALPIGESEGIEAIFLFQRQTKKYPYLKINSQRTPDLEPPSKFEQFAFQLSLQRQFRQELRLRIKRERTPNLSERERIQNRLGLLRIYKQLNNWNQVIRLSDMLFNSNEQGYLINNVRSSIVLSWFTALMNKGLHQDAILLSLQIISDFHKNSQNYTLESIEYSLNEIFNIILSLEHLNIEQREIIWNVRHSLQIHIRHARQFKHNQESIQKILLMPTDTSGVAFLTASQKIFFKLSHPSIPRNQNIIGILDKEATQNRILNTITPITREWKSIPFKISDEKGVTLLQSEDSDSLGVLSQRVLSTSFPNWALTIYQRNESDLRKESRKKMFFLYALITLSLLVLISGTFLILQGLSNERKLLFMKSNFLSSVTHELKTPLTSIRMFSEMLQRGRLKSPEKAAQYAGMINKEAHRLDTLIQGILSYTRMEQNKEIVNKQPVDLHSCAEQAINSLSNQAEEKGIALEYSLQPQCIINGDATSLLSLFQNLIENAIKYTNNGFIKVDLTSQPNHYIFSVMDSGIGIPATERKKIFQDFYRIGDEMTRTTKGSGLGLAIVKRIADAHNADVSVESEVNIGSTFKVLFKKADKNA
jgi:signal transduction histidine kinase